MTAENRPIFIVGSPRSGTSILTWCLGQHPNILPLPETHWVARLTVHMRQLYQIGSANGKYSHLGALDWTEQDFYSEFGRAIDRFVIDTREPRLRFIRKLSRKSSRLSESQAQELESKGQISPDPALVSAKNYQVVRSPNDPKGRWVDGTPENTFYMYSLSLLFPNAQFIHLLRNPNDVAQSLMRFSHAGDAGVDHTESEAFLKWRQAVEYALKGEKALGKEKVLRMDYADLVRSPVFTLGSCLDFLGENFTSHCILPLKEKINSSEIEQPSSLFTPSTKEGLNANSFYLKVLSDIPRSPDPNALSELIEHYENFAACINVL